MRSLKSMTVGELRRRYREVFEEDTRSFNKPFLLRRIAWQLQAKEYGGLSERALGRAAELADTSFLRTSAPKRGLRPLPDVTQPENRSAESSHRTGSSRDRRLRRLSSLLAVTVGGNI